MEIEANILPIAIRFEKLYKNYALKILQMQDNHPIKKRVSINSPFFARNGINVTSL